MTLGLLTFLVLAAGAAASTLVVSANSRTPGSVRRPAVQSVELAESDIGYVNGAPSRTLVSTREQLPTSFRADLGPFPSCPASDFSHLSNTPPPCPAGSQLGTTTFTAYVPTLNLHVSAAGFIYKLSDSRADAWVHVTKPVQFSVALPATLTTGAHQAAPAVSWNLSAAVNFGVKADITSFITDWTARRTVIVRHGARNRRRHGDGHRRRHRQHHERSGARTRGRRRAGGHGAPKRSTSPAKRRSRVTASPFIATGCPSTGEWSYTATLQYTSGAPETVATSLTCSATSPQTVTVTVTAPPTCVLGVVCPSPSRRSGLGAQVEMTQPRRARST
ncbi:hypothetical protein [Conexibacter sp. DBS9H8]|uniref:hypothetical protein n=1 Tax=Conexibacter sp. DBS9H8 TaxID=2937801 RepID=UPI00200CB599|nr:hypothetical protein [Conexibacter sp. DBS9H8]